MTERQIALKKASGRCCSERGSQKSANAAAGPTVPLGYMPS
jgi:hypothetical protein